MAVLEFTNAIVFYNERNISAENFTLYGVNHPENDLMYKVEEKY